MRPSDVLEVWNVWLARWAELARGCYGFSAEFLSFLVGSKYATLISTQFGMHRRRKALLLICVVGVAGVLWLCANRAIARPMVSSGTERFQLRQPFSLPQPKGSRNLESLMQSEWVGQLKAFLGTVSSGPVTLVSSDYGYREVLLNWLVSAMIRVAKSLSNILVLSLDASLYHHLVNKGISCVHISPEALLRLSLKLPVGHTAFTQVHIMRLTVMRLINHWGFDVANYDTDALILKNPEHLYYTGSLTDRDFIGSYGHFPLQQLKEWGVAVCIGVVFIRSTPQTGTSISANYAV